MTFEKNSTTQILIIILHDKCLITNTVFLSKSQNSRNSCQNYCLKPVQIKGDI